MKNSNVQQEMTKKMGFSIVTFVPWLLTGLSIGFSVILAMLQYQLMPDKPPLYIAVGFCLPIFILGVSWAGIRYAYVKNKLLALGCFAGIGVALFMAKELVSFMEGEALGLYKGMFAMILILGVLLPMVFTGRGSSVMDSFIFDERSYKTQNPKQPKGHNTQRAQEPDRNRDPHWKNRKNKIPNGQPI
jgi:hypothetical protein